MIKAQNNESFFLTFKLYYCIIQVIQQERSNMDKNFDNDRPIYIQIVEKLRIAIINGYYPPGSKIPSVRDLAAFLKVNPNTLQKALSELEDDKLIYTERTNGKYVTEDIKRINKEKEKIANNIVNSFLNEMNKIGIKKNEVIKYLQDKGGIK